MRDYEQCFAMGNYTLPLRGIYAPAAPINQNHSLFAKE
jgi:hypothetical protein